jgi:peptidoglycan/LPS O-acetylase OafA/YrhL
VIFHYQHFFFTPFALPDTFQNSQLPSFDRLSILYSGGWRAVELFFVISGFIFFYLYTDPVRSRAVRTYDFFILRFSRLYPLHCVTLIYVAVGQIISRAMDGQQIVYACNDAKRFALNLFFVTNWIPDRWDCFSFNGPVWSVSLEVFLYATFFGFALFLPARWIVRLLAAVVLAATGAIIYRANTSNLLGLPVLCFYSGGVACLLFERSLQRQWFRNAIAVIALVALSVCGARTFFHFSDTLLYAVIFPAIVLLLALCQDWHHALGKRLRLIGDISYSTYLLHFPTSLSLSLILLAKAGFVQFHFSRPATILGYLSLVVAISIASHYLFERPAQRYLRRTSLSPKQPAAKFAPS